MLTKPGTPIHSQTDVCSMKTRIGDANKCIHLLTGWIKSSSRRLQTVQTAAARLQNTISASCDIELFMAPHDFSDLLHFSRALWVLRPSNTSQDSGWSLLSVSSHQALGRILWLCFMFYQHSHLILSCIFHLFVVFYLLCVSVKVLFTHSLTRRKNAF